MDITWRGYELDTVSFPHDAVREYIRKIDELVADEAVVYLSWRTWFIVIYLEFPLTIWDISLATVPEVSKPHVLPINKWGKV
jgi:hypothetical protein